MIYIYLEEMNETVNHASAGIFMIRGATFHGLLFDLTIYATMWRLIFRQRIAILEKAFSLSSRHIFEIKILDIALRALGILPSNRLKNGFPEQCRQNAFMVLTFTTICDLSKIVTKPYMRMQLAHGLVVLMEPMAQCGTNRPDMHHSKVSGYTYLMI